MRRGGRKLQRSSLATGTFAVLEVSCARVTGMCVVGHCRITRYLYIHLDPPRYLAPFLAISRYPCPARYW